METAEFGGLSLTSILTDNRGFKDSSLYRAGASFADKGMPIPRLDVHFAAGIKKKRSEQGTDLRGFLVLLRGYFDTANSRMFSEELNGADEESYLRTAYLNNAVDALLSARDWCANYTGSVRRINNKLLAIADYANPVLGIFAWRAVNESKILVGDLANILFTAYSSVNSKEKMVATANFFLQHPGFKVHLTEPVHDYEVISQFYLKAGISNEKEASSIVRAMQSSVMIEQKNLGGQLAPLEEHSHESGTLANRVFEQLRQSHEIYRLIELAFHLEKGIPREAALKKITPVDAIEALS